MSIVVRRMQRVLGLWVAGVMALGAFSTANADIIVNVNANMSGGTNWAFSGGTGTVGGSGSHFLVGETAANPQPFHAANDQDGSLTVLAGTNAFNIATIFVRNFGSLSGINGSIIDGLDFQTSGASIGGASIASLNGLVFHANAIDFASLTAGSYVLDSYYAPYNTNLGTFTLNVGPQSSIPAPGALALLGLGLAGIGFARRKRAA